MKHIAEHGIWRVRRVRSRTRNARIYGASAACVIIAKNWISLLLERRPSLRSLSAESFCLFRADVAVYNVYIFYSRFILLSRRHLRLRC